MQEHPGEKLGRWPTNLLLVHGPGCVQTGLRDVRASNTPGSGQDSSKRAWSDDGGWKRLPGNAVRRLNEIAPGGIETVAAWDCQPDCPVRVMDEQSGDRVSGMMVAGQTRKDSYGKGGYHDGFVTAASEHGTYGDTGGASRFYPQFTDLGGALDWLSRLVNGPS